MASKCELSDTLDPKWNLSWLEKIKENAITISLSLSLSLSHLTFFTKSTDPHGDSEIPGGLSQYLDKTCQKNNAGSSSPQHVEWCWNQVPTLQQRQGAPGLQLCLAATPPSKRMENYSFIMLHHAYSEMLTCFSESPSFSILFPWYHDISWFIWSVNVFKPIFSSALPMACTWPSAQ